ncbi:non-ribosomal peptide synthetase [Micromonospora ureilytica]|uniref:Amino acid adenylation domain-containing protein n=1 Tax=Micromonospora ureilytica TaxID=709868 RepID=A0ABS0JT59_9ACTN|nr:non-ribosomal peptide synthetase [Micromonospora ureilytica]MBG6069641.1 amino acid adenylation domain-containing protein [Micromonospora ureilytica]
MLGVHGTFVGVAQRYADRVAVSDGARELTYRQVDEASTVLAARLAAVGVGRGTLVGLCVQRSVSLVVAMVAVLKTGAGYVPLDPGHPHARLRAVLADAGCPVVVGDASWRGVFTEVPTFVAIDDAGTDDVGGSFTPVAVCDDDTAYIIYTSGSTGKPKGVRVTHRNVLRLFTTTDELFDFTHTDVWSMFHSAAFDFSVWEIYGALLHGAHVVVVAHTTTRDPDAMWHLIRERHVTVLSQTPTAFANLAKAAAATAHPPTDLRYVIFGGELLQPATLTTWATHYGTTTPHLVNMYGITETTVHVTHHTITPEDLTQPHSPIGRALPDLTIDLLDPDGNPVPDNTLGEMFISGPGLSLGYHQRPALTAHHFPPNPHPHHHTHTRRYRTGDTATRQPDGTYHYHGRTDHQIQLRGYRIEPHEIEHTLQTHPHVHTAHITLTTTTDHPHLTAHITLTPHTPNNPHTQKTIRNHLNHHLPPHMIPTHIHTHTHLPTTTNGKIDPTQLPTTTPPPPPLRQSSDKGLRLSALWQETLGVVDIGVDDNFFSLGGDSILAVQLVAELREAGFDATVEKLFFHPTIRELALAIDGATSGPPVGIPQQPHAAPTRPELPPDVEAVYPTTSLQLGILYQCELSDDPGLYHDLTSVTVRGPWTEAALRDALAQMCERHEILRTRIDLAEFDQPTQLVGGNAQIPLTVDDLTGAGYAAQEEFLRDWWQRESAHPFDLTTAPMARAHVLVRSAQSFQLSVAVHHILMDGWSFARFMTELLMAYDARCAAKPAMLPAMPEVRFRDFVAAEQVILTSTEARTYWADLLADAPSLDLRALRAETGALGVVDRQETSLAVTTLPPEVSGAARRVGESLGVPTKSVYAAAYLYALGAITDASDVVAGLCTHGRSQAKGAELVLGVFLNVTPIRLSLAGRTWADLIRAVFAQEREQLAVRTYPLARIQRDLGRAPFEVMFNYTDFHTFAEVDTLTEIAVEDWRFADRTNFSMVVEVNRLHGGEAVELSVRIEPTQLAPAAAVLVSATMQDALRQLTADVSAPLSQPSTVGGP